MSNHLAPATVTAVLATRLEGIATAASSEPHALSFSVTVGHPKTDGAAAPGASVNLFLYQVMPNAAWRNSDLPGRRGDGTVSRRPQAALDLLYLLTFLGAGADHACEPERILGRVIADLHARPLLTSEMIRNALDAIAGEDAHYLDESNLADQLETVRLTPLSLDLEELSKLWSTFFEMPYALSVAYKASLVLIEADVTPHPALPVRERDIRGITWRQPIIEAVESAEGAGQPIVHDSTLLIRGRNLFGSDATIVRIGEIEQEVTAPAASESQITLPVPGGVRAGVNTVRVSQSVQLGQPREPHVGFDSNVVPFVLCPVVDEGELSISSGSLTVGFAPFVTKEQRVAVMLNEYDAPETRSPHAYRFDAPADNGIGEEDTETSSIVFPLEDVEPGQYLVRLQVDGAISPLEFVDNRYGKPKVTIS